MASITIKNLKKTYEDGIEVIHGINLEIKDKEFVIFVGPSGCGKSTTLRMIAGLEDITSGELMIGDKIVNDVPSKDRDIAMVFQSYALYPHMTVYKNMAFALKLAKEKKDVIDQKVRKAAKMLEIEDYLDRKPKALSGGQRQRVALGRAMVRNPAVFLLDEPLSNLDAKLRTDMRARISMLHKELQTTFVYVTHDQTEAMTMADRIVVMKDGYILQVDTPSNLYDHPCNMFVAGFIGTPGMNFVKAKIIEAEKRYFAVIDEYKLPLPENAHKNNNLVQYVNKEIILGIRAENLHMNKKYAMDSNKNAISLKVDLAEMLGAEIYLHGKIGSADAVAKVRSEYKVNSGDTVTLYMDMKKVHLFDAETEEIIFD